MSLCIVCGEMVEHPEFTLLCNKHDAEELAYANHEGGI